MDRNSKAFKALEAKWYDKLKASGFEDAENSQGLKRYSTTIEANDKDPDLRGAKQEYYRMAGQFYYDYKFGCARDKIAWWHHAQGVSIRDIVGILAKKGIKTKKSALHQVIQALGEEMMKGNYE